jgi:diguanylate cyclase
MNAMPINLAGTIKAVGFRLFGGANEQPIAPKGELARYREVFDTVSDFMLRHAIEPNPSNFSLVYRFAIAHEPHLEAAIEQLIDTGYAPAGAVGADCGVSEQELSEIAERAQSNLKAVEELFTKSTVDAKGFGEALEGSALHLKEGTKSDTAVDNLIRLTRAMIEKTRIAESELRLRGQAMTDLQMSLSEAQVKADTDSLTGLSNRRAFERLLGAASVRATMNEKPLSLAICDIDFFKLVNDSYGHDMGDRVLKFVGEALQESCGEKGSVSRHGGEEFVVIFEETPPEEAYEIIDAARRDLGARRIKNKETGERISAVTFSAGVSWLRKKGDVSAMLRTADRALYKAKANGRDCVAMANAN